MVVEVGVSITKNTDTDIVVFDHILESPQLKCCFYKVKKLIFIIHNYEKERGKGAGTMMNN